MRTTCSVMTNLVYGKRTPVYYGTDAEAFFEGVKLVNATLDTTAFPPAEILPFVDYIPKWIAPVCTILSFSLASIDRLNLYSGPIISRKRRKSVLSFTIGSLEKLRQSF